MIVGSPEASQVAKDSLIESEVVDLVCRLTIMICSYPKTIFNSAAASTDGTALISLEEEIVSSGANPQISQSEQDYSENSKVVDSYLQFEESNYFKLAPLTFKSLLKGLEAQAFNYNKIIFKVYILGYNNSSVTQALLMGMLFNEIFSRKSIRRVLDFNKSSFEILSLDDKQCCNAKDAQKNDIIKPIDDIDAKISALISHYVYYYLDCLEYMANHNGLRSSDGFDKILNPIYKTIKASYENNKNNENNKKNESNKKNETNENNKNNKGIKDHTIDIIKPVVNISIAILGNTINNLKPINLYKNIIASCKFIKDTATGTSLIAFGGKKVFHRVVNRMMEVVNIVQLKSLTPPIPGEIPYQDTEKLLRDIFDYTIIHQRPYEFYEFYEKLGYWEYIKRYLGDDTLQKEAKLWHVVHPYSLINKLSNNVQKTTCKKTVNLNIASSFFWEESITIDNIKKNIYFNNALISGMSGLSGYGGALFVKIREYQNKPEKFNYASKGTDFNSINDWVMADVLQAFTGFSLQHVHAVKNSITLYQKIKGEFVNVPLMFCGHSLGGGLASSNAVSVPDCHAITYNAAGLNFIGSLWTRVVGAVANFSVQTLRPQAIAERVHPIRIQHEIVDVLMIVAKFLTCNLNERAYGRNALEFRNVDLSSGKKHGINNFLYCNIMKRLRILKKEESQGIVQEDIEEINGGIKTRIDTPITVKIKEGVANIVINSFKFVATGAITFASFGNLTKN